MELVGLFPRAYYYFSIVVHEYPKSEWYDDAREKMELIETRIGMYKKIIESFTTWNIDKKTIIGSYEELHTKHMKTHSDLTEDDKKEWKK
jgi:outer membrane protein assembly factor BamD (BamD/ComL family)